MPCTSTSGRPSPAENTAIDVPSGATTNRDGASGKGPAKDPVRPAGCRRPRPRRGSRSPGRGALPGPGARAHRRPSTPARAPPPSRRPADTTMTRRAAATSRGCIVTRSTWGSMCVGAGTAVHKAGESQTAEPGNTERMCPSGPTPTTNTSKAGSDAGDASIAGPCSRIMLAYPAAAQAAPPACAIASVIATWWIWDAGMRTPSPWPPTSAPSGLPPSSSPPLVEQHLGERQHVRQRVVGRHEPVVAPPDVDARPVDALAQRRPAEVVVDPRRGRAAGRHPVRDAARRDRRVQAVRDLARRRRGHRVVVGQDPQRRHAVLSLRVAHAAPSTGAPRPGIADQRRGHPDRLDGQRVTPADLERLAQEVHLAPARRLERPVHLLRRHRARRARGRSRPPR